MRPSTPGWLTPRSLVSLLLLGLAGAPLAGCAGPELGDDEGPALSDPVPPGPVDEEPGDGPGDDEEPGQEGALGPIYTGDVAPPRPAGVDVDYGPGAPTVGWRSEPFRYGIHHPHNLEESARYSRQGNVHTMRVVNGDAPFKSNSGTDPRTEMRWVEEYESGRHMFDADFKIDSVGPNKAEVEIEETGEDGRTRKRTVVYEKGTCIMQILRLHRPEGGPATALMLSARPDGTIRPWFGRNAEVLFRFQFGRWYNLKVAHDASKGDISVYFDDRLVHTRKDRGRATHHFKNGVYGAGKRSNARFEPGSSVVHFRGITYWRR